MSRRVIFYLPFHWMFLPIYFLLSIPLIYTILLAPYYILHWISIPSTTIKRLIWILVLLISLSPLLGFINIKLWGRKRQALVATYGYISVWGIPIPLPKLEVIEQESIIAINVGGALIPIINSLIMIYIATYIREEMLLEAIIASVIVTTIYSFYMSRTIPGIGIVAPGLGIAAVSLLVSLIFIGRGPLFIPAYVGSTFGSLIGADLIRLVKDWEKLNSPFLSIGGAGIFDGIFISGAISISLGMILS